MYTIVGLGNPGEEYEKTRHNAGREVIFGLAEKLGVLSWKTDSKAKALVASAEIDGEKVKLILPETFMNKSGSAVAYFVKTPKAAEKMIVVHDDLDLPLGTLRFSFGRGSGGHKGVESIARALKTKDFIRLRVGISKSSRGKTLKPKGDREVQDFVLGQFDKKGKEEWKDIEKSAIAAIEMVGTDGLEQAMTAVNRSQ